MRLFFCLALCVFILKGVYSQTNTPYCDQQQFMLSIISHHHTQPPVFDKQTRDEIVDLFMDMVDRDRTFFLQKDVAYFKELVIPSETGFCVLIEEAAKVYTQRLQQTDSLLAIITQHPIAFTEKDTVFYFSKRKRGFMENTSTLKKRLEKILKIDVLEYLLEPKDKNEKRVDMSDQELTAMEPKARELKTNNWRKNIKKTLADKETLKSDVAELLLKAIAHRCDPHTDYFAPEENTYFRKILSAETETFGFYVTIEEEKNRLVIASMTPGSPAWRSNEMHEGDEIIRIDIGNKQFSEEEYIDAEKLNELLDAPEHKKIKILLRKKNSLPIEIELMKEKIKTEENIFSSYVLGDGHTKVGYIPLPSFYTNYEENSTLGCANDVAKEIIRLKEENIQGLIIDLRNNGGGSMAEAMNLAGIFINEGPLAVCKGRHDKPRLMKDMNRGTIYDGPLVVLVNGSSASASEFFSAAVQDYNRAVIVGAPTYGKATFQVILPLDTTIWGNESKQAKVPGFIKITGGQFFRVTAKSHQSKGIFPDILLPDPAEAFIKKEVKQTYALKADSVNKKILFMPYSPLKLGELLQKSKKRQAENSGLVHLTAFSDSLTRVAAIERPIPVTFNGFKKIKKETESLEKKLEHILNNPSDQIKVENTASLLKVLEFDNYQKEQNDKKRKELQNDLLIQETFFITKDLIQSTSTK